MFSILSGMAQEGSIVIKGARSNNLKNIDVEIPRGKLVVVTGLSGSGKSSLVFDTLFAEGQRRFAESISSYARQFLGRMTKPDVDSIEGIPPAIAIEQKVNVRNPRSTVATTTEIYDYLRIIYARIGRTYSPISGGEVRKDSVADVLSFIREGDSRTIYILADVRWKDRQDKVELMLALKEDGFSRFYDCDSGTIVRIEDVMTDQAAYESMNLFLLVDRAKLDEGENGRYSISEDLETRFMSSIASAFDKGDGMMRVIKENGPRDFSTRFELDGMTFSMPDDYMFSFNSPIGACKVCGGLGNVIGVSEDLVIPDKTKSIYDGAIACWRGDKMGWFNDHLIQVADRYNIPIFTPWCELSEEARKTIWYGHSVDGDDESIVGIKEFFDWVETQRYKIQFRFMLNRFSGRTVCPDCGGSRLRKDALYVRVGGKNIHEVLSMNVNQAIEFFEKLELTPYEREIVDNPIQEIVSRLKCLDDVGLAYLTLSRNCNTLSGGESQRINLVAALGSSLVGSMYILDEPSIGLHPRDTERLISVLRRLRDIGNTVVVVEHDEEIIKAADILVDMGPKAGLDGGSIIYQGSLKEGKQPTEKEIEGSLTLQYILGRRQRVSRVLRKPYGEIKVLGAMEHNLKNVDVSFPLGTLTVVTGVSGSGKSSLVGDILYPALYRHINESGDLPGLFHGLAGDLNGISRVEYVDQNPIGKSSRSNAVTYLKAWDDIRKLLSEQRYAKINGYTPSFFSFNQDGGRCPDCQGEGYVHIEMQFMADVTMLCESCGGKRFKPDILEVRYNGKNVDDILDMTVDEAVEFFSQGKEEHAKHVVMKLKPLQEVGLGYIKLGQSSSTLSGGESQRIKLASFLSMSESRSNRILFIFDEPTTGLHFHDVEKLIKAFDALLDKGHSLVVVEHNMDVIRAADWLIDLGPEAGDAGGNVVFAGTPGEMAAGCGSWTARYL